MESAGGNSHRGAGSVQPPLRLMASRTWYEIMEFVRVLPNLRNNGTKNT